MEETVINFEKNQNKVSKSKQHWRLLTDKQFLVGEMLPEAGATMTLTSIEKQEVQSQKGTEQKAVATFKETPLKIIFNKTNLERTAEVLGTPYYEEWIGKKITFIPVSIQAFGKKTIAIRVK